MNAGTRRIIGLIYFFSPGLELSLKDSYSISHTRSFLNKTFSKRVSLEYRKAENRGAAKTYS